MAARGKAHRRWEWDPAAEEVEAEGAAELHM